MRSAMSSSEPLRSAKRTVTSLRSPSMADDAANVPLRRELLARIGDPVSAPSDGHVYRPRDLYHGCGLPGTLTRKL
jgi:hypothetical protein